MTDNRLMGFIAKWYAFGEDPDLDAGVRAYEAGDDAQAADFLRASLARLRDRALRERARNYLAGALGRRAKLNVKSGDWESAARCLTEAVSTRPQFADLHMALAVALDRLGKPGERDIEVEAALRLNGQYGHAVLFDAARMLEAGEEVEGLARAFEAVSLDPSLDTTGFREGIDLVDTGELAQGAERLRQAVPERQASQEVALEGDRAMAEGRWAEATASYRRSVAEAPGFADLRCRLGQALLEAGDLDGATAEFTEAVRLNPKYAEAHALLGVAYRRALDEDSAQAAFQKALEADPTNVIAKQESVSVRG